MTWRYDSSSIITQRQSMTHPLKMTHSSKYRALYFFIYVFLEKTVIQRLENGDRDRRQKMLTERKYYFFNFQD